MRNHLLTQMLNRSYIIILRSNLTVPSIYVCTTYVTFDFYLLSQNDSLNYFHLLLK